MKLLPVQPAHQLQTQPLENRWLVEELWSQQAVGLIGGEPKCGKSLLALQLAVAVATGTPCLRRFAVPHPGRVLLFAAEDALHVVRQRLEGICHLAGVAIEQLDVHVITAPRLRLDLPEDAESLAHTVATLRPRLLVLDPFVRLHRRDENASADVAPLLDLLRQLQRAYEVAVVLVHHAKKGGGRARAGQALRGSSEFHAWLDSLLYLRRHGDRLTLSVEHRAAAGIEAIAVRWRADDNRLALELDRPPAAEPAQAVSAPQRIHNLLVAAWPSPVGFGQLLTACQLRKATLCQQLADLTRRGEVLKTDSGYTLPST